MVPVASVYLGLIGATQGYETMGPSTVIDRVARPAPPGHLRAARPARPSAGPTTVMVAWSAPYVLGLVAASVRPPLNKTRKRHQKSTRQPLSLAGGLQGLLGIHASAILRLNIPGHRPVAGCSSWLAPCSTPASAAIYAFATRLLQFGLFVANSVGQVVQPRLGRLLAQGERERARGLYQVATGWQVAVTWPQYLIVAAFAAVLLRLLFGADFGDGAPVVLILAISTLVGAAAGPVDIVFLMTGKSTWSMWNTAAALGVPTSGLNLLLIPRDRDPRGCDCLGGGESCGQRPPADPGVPLVGFHPFGRELGLAVTGSVVRYSAGWLWVRITFAVLMVDLGTGSRLRRRAGRLRVVPGSAPQSACAAAGVWKSARFGQD